MWEEGSRWPGPRGPGDSPLKRGYLAQLDLSLSLSLLEGQKLRTKKKMGSHRKSSLGTSAKEQKVPYKLT